MTRSLAAIRSLWPRVQADTLQLNRHCLPLDGVRGIAVLLVLCYDCLKLAPAQDSVTLVVRRIAASGWIGVDLFFVLSGFLITGVLLEARGRAGYWKSFLMRRAVRIFPLYYTTLLGVFFIVPAALWIWGASPTTLTPFEDAQKQQFWYWMYLQNWLFAWQQAWPTAIPIKHFWSLAIEEQFYLVWPLAVALLTRRQLGWLCVALSLTSISLRYFLLNHGVSGMVVFVMTITRLDGLCIGAGLAIALRNETFRQRVAHWFPLLAVSSLLGLAGLDLVYPVLQSESYAAYSIGHTVTALTFAMLIGAAQCAPAQHILSRGLSSSCLTLLGKYSYGIYVFHKFVHAGVLQLNWEAVSESWRGWGVFAASLIGSILAALVSWKFLEQPCLALKKFFPRPDEGEAHRKSVSARSEISTSTLIGMKSEC